jgi:hypothetical protein
VRRGHVYAVEHQDGTAHLLVVSNSDLNSASGSATAVQVHPRGATNASIIDIELREPQAAMVVLGEFRTFGASYFHTDLGPVDARALEAVDVGLRTVFDL